MRLEKPNPKKLTQVEVPADLRQFLEEVADLIEARDESTLIESDDLLQCEFAYGGLIEEGAPVYGFTYFPRKAVSRKTWELEFSAHEISEIADRSIDKLELWACEDESCGSMFSSANYLCSDCDYVDDEVQEVRVLPSGDFSSRRDWALAYFALHPDADPFEMIGDYNGKTELGLALGYFSLNEAQEILRLTRGRLS